MSLRRLAILAVALCGTLFALASANAAQPVVVRGDQGAIDLTRAADVIPGGSDRIQVSTTPGPDGIVRRFEVRAREAGTSKGWMVFTLTNESDEQLDRLIVAPHFRLVGSGLLWPDLGSRRLVDVTASLGFRPEQEDSREADVFSLTLDPGTTTTFVAELATPNVPQIYLWEPDAYKDKENSLTLYKGIVLGIAGLLSLILTILFVVKGSVMFPAAAALAWAVLGWLCIDFGFWHKIFDVDPGTDQIYRAGAEAVLPATLLVFLVAYLNLNRWHMRFVHIAGAWLAVLIAILGLALIDAPMASGIARISLALVAVLGFGVVVWLAFHDYDRAVMLIPTWFLLVVWVAAAGLTVTGIISNDLVAPSLVGGLVLVVLLIGFTVMQHAFAGGGLATGLGGELERKALALTGAGDIVWDWDVGADKVHVSGDIEMLLGLRHGALAGPISKWLDVLHPSDRDRFRAALDALVGERRGRLSDLFRLRSNDGHYFWFTLRARPVVGSDGEVVRCVGTLLDVTESKTTEERLLHNAVHDNLTGLPNRELFLDRLEAALTFASNDDSLKPTVLILDIDRFKKVNEAVGVSVGDTIMLTVVRRLARLLKPQDTLARLGGDQFGLILLSEREVDRITGFADALRKTLRTPISFGGREIFLTASIGLALSEPKTPTTRDDLLKSAEVAMYHAKRLGGDHIEVYKPTMRTAKTDRLLIEGELRRALERDEIKVHYQPIVRLEDRTIAGFEALVRWDHPRYGRRPAGEFISIAEETGLIVELGLFVLERAARQLSIWQQKLPLDPPLFITVNASSRQFLKQDLVNDVKGVLSRSVVARGSLKLEIVESVVMENPEHAAQMMLRLRELGIGLALDDFGTGYSSLAYLQKFSFDTLKIDRSFVRPQGRGPRPVILRTIVQLGHDLGLDVVAEGAETDSDAVELYHLGCEYAQGFAFGEAMPPNEVDKLLGLTEDVPKRGVRRIAFGAGAAQA